MISQRPTILPVHIPSSSIVAISHLYWRLLITASGGSVVTIEEVQMYDINGNSLTTGGTASASSYYAPEGLTPASAFDSNFSTMWASNNVPSVGSPEWIKYQFVSPVAVAVIRLVRREDGFGLSQRPVTFKIQWSDNDSSWTDIGTFNPTWPPIGLGLSFKVALDPGYVNLRTLILTTQDGTAPDCAELQLRGIIGGPSLVTSTDYHYYFGSDRADALHDFSNPFDGSAFSYWRGGVAPPNNWFAAAHNKIINIVEILYQASDASFAKSATSLKIQGSNDGASTWNDIGVVSFSTWTALSQTQVRSL